MEFTLGKQPDNDIVINEPVVSRHHLRITYLADNKLLLEDLGSTNSTFVNGNKISKKLISPLDEVSLGSAKLDTDMVFSFVLKKVKEARMDFIAEFNDLKSLYFEYEKKVNGIKKKSQVVPLLMKAGFTVGAMVLAFFIFGNNPELRYPVMMAAGIIGGFVTLSSKSETKIKDKIDTLDVELSERYKCPKCGKSLFGKRWTYWAAYKKCANCQAIWIK